MEPLNTLYTHAYRTPVRAHTHTRTHTVREYHWWKRVCRSPRMDGESIWNWSAYVALIPAFGADFRLTIQTLLMHRNHICLLPILVVNNQQVRWGSVFLLLLTSIAFLLTSLQIQKKGEMPGVEDPPPLFSFNNSWRLKETSHRNLSIPRVNNAVWNLMAWVILGFLYTHIFFQ